MGQLLLLVFLVVEAVKVGQLALMQHAHDPHAVADRPVEHDVTHVPDPKEPWADVVARAANAVTVSQVLAERLKPSEIRVGLSFVPSTDRVFGDVADVRAGERRCAKRRH